MVEQFSRRSLLAFAAAALPDQKRKRPARTLPRAGEFARYLDTLTENPVIRVTSLASASYLPQPGAPFLSVREHVLLFASDRCGKFCPFAMDLRAGVATQLADTGAMRPDSLALAPNGRFAYLLDGGTLKEINLASRKATELAGEITAFSLGSTPQDTIVVRGDRLERLNEPGRALAEQVGNRCWIQPNARGALYVRKGAEELWYTSFSASSKPVLLAKGSFSSPCWSPDGNSVLLLREVPLSAGATTTDIHELAIPQVPPSGESSIVRDIRVARTSRFASFSPNGDASMFIGASRSRAQPSVILLDRSLQREMVLCEHRATDPARVRPSFSPDSRRVFFQSDFQGKPAIYTVDVERLVEPTQSE